MTFSRIEKDLRIFLKDLFSVIQHVSRSFFKLDFSQVRFFFKLDFSQVRFFSSQIFLQVRFFLQGITRVTQLDDQDLPFEFGTICVKIAQFGIISKGYPLCKYAKMTQFRTISKGYSLYKARQSEAACMCLSVRMPVCPLLCG